MNSTFKKLPNIQFRDLIEKRFDKILDSSWLSRSIKSFPQPIHNNCRYSLYVPVDGQFE